MGVTKVDLNIQALTHACLVRFALGWSYETILEAANSVSESQSN